ncbi:MAG: hypothetical protein RL377_1016 [Bacteroidota bacterium]|jgi:hypothetical protein
MRRIQLIFLFIGLLLANTITAQHIQLLENRGEVGVMGGAAYYRGDIASDQLFYKPNYGVYYKRQLNDYVGLRFTYEYIALGANDLQSNNIYDYRRGLFFERTAHEFNIMGEFYFLKFISGNKHYRYTPYLGFGIGAWKTISARHNVPSGGTPKTIVFPINLGFKYNVKGPWNLFGECTYRFVGSDRVDYFSDYYNINGFQASKSGNDQYFTAKLGLSYNLLKVYGPDKPKSNKRSFFNFGSKNSSNSGKKGILGFLKRN